MIALTGKARTGAVLALAILIAGCSNAPRPQTGAGASQTIATAEIDAIADLLEQGERGKAKKRISAGLKRDPNNASLMLLRDSMEKDPLDLLGPKHFVYEAKSGDTIPALAQRFLGNRLKAHQLARYNGLESATSLRDGQALRIPVQAPQAEPARRVEKRPAPQPAARPKATPPAQSARTPSPVPANPAAAQRSRSQGLAALHQGNPALAVTLLSRAAALDPTNAAIERDLKRAQRIRATVQARK